MNSQWAESTGLAMCERSLIKSRALLLNPVYVLSEFPDSTVEDSVLKSAPPNFSL